MPITVVRTYGIWEGDMGVEDQTYILEIMGAH